MKETGEVVKLEGKTAYLLFRRTSMCAKCGACGIVAGQNTVTVTAANTLDASVGDRVEVEFSSDNALKSSLVAYVFPLIMLFVGIWLGYTIPQDFFEVKDALATIMGLVFAALAFIILRLLNPFFKRKLSNVYTMVKIEAGLEDAP